MIYEGSIVYARITYTVSILDIGQNKIYVYIIMYYSLRITLAKVFNLATDDDITKLHRHRLKYLLADIVREKICPDTNYVLGYEETNKYGEKTHAHYHFNFESDVEKETLRKWLTRTADKKEYKLKGKECYCFQQHNNVDDYHRWFRYCLKEKMINKYTSYKADSGAPTLEELIMLAKDEKKRSVQSNCLRREKMNNKLSYFDKIVSKMESLDPKLLTQKQIFIFITTYYVEDKKPVNPVTIRGYINNYMLMKKLISYDEFYELNN